MEPSSQAPVVTPSPITPSSPTRRHLPQTRTAITHEFSIAGHEGDITVGLFEDGTPGELFVSMHKEGSTIGGLLDVVATFTSLLLQYGIPLEVLVKKFTNQRFEPSGSTACPEIRTATSIVDYIFRWMAHQFIPSFGGKVKGVERSTISPSPLSRNTCPNCGHEMVQHGLFMKCMNCGESKGS